MPRYRNTCSVPSCGILSHSHGFCSAHVARWKKHGDPGPAYITPKHRTIADRFWSKVDRSADCWIWLRSRNPAGYGKFGASGSGWILAHRWAYEQANGPIPDGITLDHLCRTRACVRPDHLEPVTRAENVLRGEGIPAVAARATACMRGHAFATGDVRHYGPDNRWRACRTCERIRRAH